MNAPCPGSWPAAAATTFSASLDEVGYLPLASEAAAALFQVVTQRSLKGAIALTTNLGVGSRGKIFDDPMVVAMLDRLLHRSIVFITEGTQS